MTSKSLFFNLMKEDIKRRLWTVALSFLAFFFSLPVATAMITGRWNEVVTSNPASYERMVLHIKSFLGINNGFIGAIVVVASLVLGVNSFSWLHSRQKVDFYHGLPISRGKLFWVNYLNGILIPAAAYGINLALTLLVAAVNGIGPGLLVGSALKGFGFFLLHFAMLYSVTVLAMMMTGNILVGILGTGVFHFYFPILLAVLDSLSGTFLKTRYSGSSSLPDILMDKCSAVTLFISNFERLNGSYDMADAVQRLTAVFVVTVVVTLLSLILYKKRGSEAAGKAMAFRISEPVIRIPIVVLSALSGSLFFWSMKNSLGWAVFGLICGTILSHCVIEIIYHFDFKKLLGHRIQMAVCGAAAAVVFLGYQHDIMGYDSYIPAPGAVSEMAISLGDMDYWIDYGTVVKYDDGSYDWKGDGRSEYIFDHSQYGEEESKTARALVERAVELVEIEKNGLRESEEIQPYVTFSVRYQLKSGRKVSRTYFVRGNDIYQMTLALYGTPSYRRASIPILSRTAEDTALVQVVTNNWTREADRDKTAEILAAYQEEMLALTTEEMLHENPVGQIQFMTPLQVEARSALEEKKSSSRYSIVVERGYYPVYPSFEKTIGLLKECGIEFEAEPQVEDIRSITAESRQVARLFENREDSGDYEISDEISESVEVTDPDEIAALMSVAVPTRYGYMNSVRGNEERLFIEVTSGEGKKLSTKEYGILQNEVPEFIFEKIK